MIYKNILAIVLCEDDMVVYGNKYNIAISQHN